ASFGIWLIFKYKILSYFSDTLDFVIVKNLGGGSLFSAFEYIADEAFIFITTLLIIAVAYWFGQRLIKGHADSNDHPVHTPLKIRLRYLLPLLLVITTLLVAWVGKEPQFRYGLRKTTAYTLIAKTLDKLSDFDGDGYGFFWFPTDPDNFDSNVYPGALDIPGNGLDEDGYGGDFQLPEKKPDTLGQLPRQAGKHILLVVLESARADLVGKKTGDGRLVAPNLTNMAINGSQVEYAYSHTGYTVTSLRAVFNRTLSEKSNQLRLLDFLNQSGYIISIISGQDESFGKVAASTGMNAPGHYYFDARTAIDDRVYPSKNSGSLRLSEERVLQQFAKRVAETDWSKPNFFYVNLQAAHFPYHYPGMPRILINSPIARNEISYDNRKQVQATYWNAIAVADETFGRMIDTLKQKGVYGDTLVLVLGDHGESLFDDGYLGHGFALNETQTRIPLIINQKGIEIVQAVGQSEVAEILVTAALGRFDPKRWEDPGRSLFQFVGSLDRPQLIGIVSSGETRTILDLNTRKLFFNQSKGWVPFDDAIHDNALGARAKALIEAWETAR
ncbi:MAG TPA: hypothetical protein EYP90_02950, partial [Chromatiaceae bacterium]|nr:hypothetical protein [Chromatiaceae bacterium]